MSKAKDLWPSDILAPPELQKFLVEEVNFFFGCYVVKKLGFV